jgi:RNA polymerase sigma-70 factor (ECF subfamily)
MRRQASEGSVTEQDQFAALMQAVAERRDRDAFTRLFDHFAPRLNAYLIRLKLDRAAAEEITQEVMVTVWRKAGQFDPRISSLTTWIYRIARNRRIDVLRRDRIDFMDPMDFAYDVPADDPELDRQVDGLQREEAVRGAMQSLPDEQRKLVRLAFFEGLSHSEIADQTGLPLGTVKSRIRLAFARLRRALEAEGVMEAS